MVLVGGGRMGEALLGGLLASGWATAGDLAVAEVSPTRRAQLTERFPGVAVVEQPVPAEGAVVAVKPADVAAACRQLDSPRVLSIAAGVTLATLEGALRSGTAVIRAMPNTPTLVGAGASAIAGGGASGAADLAWAEEVLSAVGTVCRVTEAQLDAVTGLSGSGPAYVFLVVEALIDAGVLAGLTRDVAAGLAVQTLLGSARLLAEGDAGPADLRAAVTSPGGTTAAGLRVLEQAGVRAAFLDAVAAATERSRQLGRS